MVLGAGDGLRIHRQEHAQQTLAQGAKGLTLLRVAGDDAEVAFAVESHGAVAEIGRGDPQNLIIADHQLGVNHQTTGLQAGDFRIADPQAAMAIRRAQPCQEPRPKDVHGVLFQPVTGLLREDDQDLRSRILLQRMAQGIADGSGRQVLILDIQQFAALRDRVEVEPLDLPDFVMIAVCRQGARNADLGIAQ